MPGASKVLLGGVVSYALQVKRSVLAVENIDEDTVVTERCAKQMAAGVMKLTGAKLTVSTTGLAGPDGGTEQTPVGTVFIGCAYRGEVRTEEHHFKGDRQAVRKQTVQQAFKMIMNCMKGGQ